jgi:hypothetical protein
VKQHEGIISRMLIDKPIFEVGDKFSNRRGNRGIYTEVEIIRIESVHSYPDDIFDRWQVTLLITYHEGIMWRKKYELLSQKDAKNKIDAIMLLKQRTDLY